MQSFKIFGAGMLSLALLGLSACSLLPGGEAAGASEGKALPIVDGAPDFQGPWAEDLRRDYLENDNQYWRAAIADGKISEREYDEVRNRSVQCLRDGGLTDARVDADGYISHSDIPSVPEEEQKDILGRCDEKSGLYPLEIWYTLLRANPDNLDWQAGELECLIGYGLLPPGATKQDMQNWYDQDKNREHPSEAHVCSTDPFGKLGLADELAPQSN